MDANEFKFYGVSEINELRSEFDQYKEEILVNGFTVVPDVLPQSDLDEVRTHVDEVYAAQAAEIGGEDRLRQINDVLVGRCLLAYDDYFLGLATNPKVLKVVASVLGEYFTILQQNAVINAPTGKHFQTAWHRDLAYQHYTSSRPLAVSALYCVDEFSEVTGGTYVLPGSHKTELFPSREFVQKYEKSITAQAGSALVFDSMVYHRGGLNTSTGLRRGINHLFGLPFIKQQISLPQALGGKYKDDAFLNKFLGYATEPAESALKWRSSRLAAK